MTREEALRGFDPNSAGIEGKLFGLPYDEESADFVVIPAPWEVTVSYGNGTSAAPLDILAASAQVDLHHPLIKSVWKLGVVMEEPEVQWSEKSESLRKLAEEVIVSQEKGDEPDQGNLDKVNEGSHEFNNWIYQKSKDLLQQNKIPVLLGGDHSCPLGMIKAYAEQYDDLGLLQIDAHADLRNAYEGFEYSHASIMFNVLKETKVRKLVQVGIRDYCDEEWEFMEKDERVVVFPDHAIRRSIYGGTSWEEITKDIVSRLPQKVYISFDIDGLSPDLCPNTGTPVPGGPDLSQVSFLVEQVVRSGREIVGFDLCEVSSGETGDWDANVGARVLFMLLGFSGVSRSLLEWRQ